MTFTLWALKFLEFGKSFQKKFSEWFTPIFITLINCVRLAFLERITGHHLLRSLGVQNFLWSLFIPVSYTHLTLPTNREV